MLDALCEHFVWTVNLEWFFEFPPNYPNHILKMLALPELKQYYLQSGSLLFVMYQVGVQNLCAAICNPGQSAARSART
jgi:hypothetical protein